MDEIQIIGDNHPHNIKSSTPQPQPPNDIPQIVKPIIIVKQSPYGRRIEKLLLKNSSEEEIQYGIGPRFLQDILRKQKGVVIKLSLFDAVERVRKMVENKVYDGLFTSREEYLQNFYLKEQTFKESNNRVHDYLQKLLLNAMRSRQNNIVQQIEKDQLFVYKAKEMNKEDLEEIEKLDQMRLIKIRQGKLRNKLDLLNDRMDQIKQLSDASFNNNNNNSILEKIKNDKSLAERFQYEVDSFDLKSKKTKLAEEYIKSMAEKRKQKERKKSEEQKRKQQVALQAASEKMHLEELKEKEKKLLEFQKKEAKRKQKEQKQKEVAETHQKLLSMLQKFQKNKPLFKKKQEQFQIKILKPQKQQQLIKLIKISEQHQPMKFDEIDKHERKYLDQRANKLLKWEEDWQNLMEQRRKEQRNYYVGKFHSLVKTKQLTPIEIELYKKHKKIEYSKQVRLLFKPKIDVEKQTELIELVARTQRRNRKLRKRRPDKSQGSIKSVNQRYQVDDGSIPQIDGRKVGNDYLKFSKQLAKKQRQKQKKAALELKNIELSQIIPQKQQSQPQLHESNTDTMIKSEKNDHKRHVAAYLESWKQDLNNQKLNIEQRAEMIRMKSLLIDKKASNKQKVFRNMSVSDPFTELHLKAQIDDQYLSSIKAKMAVLNFI